MNIQQKQHLSASQLESFCRCPEAYRRRYLEREIIPPGIAMLKGTGLHGGAKVNFTQKIESREDLPTSEIIEAAVSEFEAATHGGYVLTPEEASRGPATILGEAKDAVADMAAVHAELQAPDYQPVMVEKTVRIELPNSPRDLLGIIDLADDKARVVDFKTAGKRKTQADADGSVQLTVYAAAYQREHDKPPAEVRLDTIVQLKTKTDRQIVSSSRGDADFNALANRINVVQRAIDAGNFPPATPNSWWCHPKWCGFFRSCPYVNAERLAKSEGGAE